MFNVGELGATINADRKPFDRTLDSVFRDGGRRMQSLGQTMSMALTLPLAAAGGLALKTAADYEQLEVQLSNLTGSAERGAEVFQKLQQWSAETPFRLDNIIRANNTLIGMGQTADEAFENVQLLGNVASATGANIRDLARVFGQASAEGRLMTRDIREFINQGVPAVKLLADSMGVAQDQIFDMASEGEISYEKMRKAIADVAAEGGDWANATQDQAKTLAGLWSTLRDNVDIALGEIGNSIAQTFDIEGVITGLTDSIGDAIEWFNSLSEGTRAMAFQVAGLLGASGPIIAALGTLSIAFSAISWPVMLGVTAFSGAVGVIMNNWDSIVAYFTNGEGAQIWETIKGSARSLYSSLSDLFTSATSFIQTVWNKWGDEIIQGTKDAFQTIQTTFEVGFDLISTILDGFTAAFSGDWDTFFDNLEQRTERWKNSTATDLKDVAQFLARIGDLVTITPGEGAGLDEMLGTDVVDMDNINSDLQKTNNIASKTPLIFREGQKSAQSFWATFNGMADQSVQSIDKMLADVQQFMDFLSMDFGTSMEAPEVDMSFGSIQQSANNTEQSVDDLSDSIGQMPPLNIDDKGMQAASGSLEDLQFKLQAFTNMQNKLDPSKGAFWELGGAIGEAQQKIDLLTSKMKLSRGELLDYGETARLAFDNFQQGAQAAFASVVDGATTAFGEALFKAREYNIADLKLRKHNLQQQEQALRNSLANQEIAQQEFNLRLQSLYNQQAKIESKMAKAREGIFKRSMRAMVNAAESAVKQILAEFAKIAFIKGISALLGFGGVSTAAGFAGKAFGAIFGGSRANGGPVMAGRSYTVGEKGPERFIPSTNGTVQPMQKSSGMASASAIGQEVSRQITKHMQRLGPNEFYMLSQKGRRGF